MKIRIPPLFDWAKMKTKALVGKHHPMRKFAKWHIWLAWLTGIPILMWTVTGLVMVAKPIDEVRGNHLRVASEKQALPAGNPAPVLNDMDELREWPVELRSFMQNGRPVTIAEYSDGRIERYSAETGLPIAPLDGDTVRALVAERIVGGNQVVSATLFEADNVPFDFRRPMPAWQVELADGTHVYVGRDTGEIAAVRTRWWRIFDFMWGLHIMDLQDREDTSHPILILFAGLAVIGSLLGTMLMFRRRKARVQTAKPSEVSGSAKAPANG